MSPSSAAASVATLACVLLSARPAKAADGDGVYGRFDGDLELRAEAGAAFAAGGPALGAGLSALYLCSAGLYAHYTDALGAEGPRVTRSIAGGVRIAPLFLARYALNGEHGPAHVDLLLDSLSLDVGAFWADARGRGLGPPPGLEIALGLALPFLPRATGPFLGVRGAIRWRPEDFVSGSMGSGAIDRGAVLSLTLGWRHVVGSHLVDAGDGLVR